MNRSNLRFQLKVFPFKDDGFSSRWAIGGGREISLEALDRTTKHVRQFYTRRYKAGEIVFDVGECGESLFVLEEGVIELIRPGLNAMRFVMRVYPGEFFGELSVVLGGARSVRACALTDVVALELDAGMLQQMCVERPEIAIRMMKRLAGRVLELEEVLAQVGKDKLLHPLIDVLMEQATPHAQGLQVQTSLTQLSRDTGLSMLETHHGLHELFDQNLLVLLGEQLMIPDMEALRNCLDTLPRSSAALDSLNASIR